MKSKLLVVLFGCVFANATMGDSSRYSGDILRHTFGYDEKTQATVKISQIQQGCRSRDCIPAINKPSFGSKTQTIPMDDKDVVMLVDYNDVQKAYPLKIMQGHEIVNDSFNGKPLAVTYCPLCASAVAFIPKVNGEVVEFGVSGLLHNSDLVMYDRKTYSLWGQITGRAIMGPQTGNSLERVYVAQISWLQAKTHYPKLRVLQPPSGSRQNYQRNFYASYFQTDKTMFPVALKDTRLRQKTKVHGFIVDGQAVAVVADYLTKQTALLHTVNGQQLNIVQKADGTVHIKALKGGQQYLPTLSFWFAWYNFHPETLLISP